MQRAYWVSAFLFAAMSLFYGFFRNWEIGTFFAVWAFFLMYLGDSYSKVK